MDELELLKKDWQKGRDNFPKHSAKDIYKMIHSKSSSIVKWIFIISLIEFAFWLLISFLLKDAEWNQKFEEYNADAIWIPIVVAGYIILAYFFYRFYMNYRNISTTDSAKLLMENILRTRRTVKHYVAFNLIYMALGVFVVLGIQMNRDNDMRAVIEQASADGELFKFYAMAILITLATLAVLIGVFLLFYFLIYGLLLKRLKRNYGELKKLEV